MKRASSQAGKVRKVSETRMMPSWARPQGQGERFGEVLVEHQHPGTGTGELGHFDGVGKPIAEVVGEPGCEYLGLGLQPAEGARVDHAVAVALKRITVRMGRLGVQPPPATLHRKPKAGQHGEAAPYPGGNSPSFCSAV